MNHAALLSLHDHWEELTGPQKLIAIDFGFFSILPCALLPKYQASKNERVRRSAETRFTECMKEHPVKELPDYLTDPDPTIRKMAKELMDDGND